MEIEMEGLPPDGHCRAEDQFEVVRP